MIGLTLVEVHFFATDFLKRVVELIVGPVDIFFFFSVVPEEVFIITDVVGILIVVVSGMITERGVSEFVQDEDVVSGNVINGTTILSGEIVRVLVEAVLVVEDVDVSPVLISVGAMIVGVFITFKESA